MDGIEYWGLVPLKHKDGASNRVVTMLEGETARSTINPHAKGFIPFVDVVTNPMTGRFFGLSPNEVNRFLQDSADQFLMLMSDAAAYMVRPQYLAGIGLQADTDRIQAGVMNDIIPCSNPEMLVRIERDYNALQFAAQQIMNRKQSMRESSGSLAPVQESLGADRMAATVGAEIVRLASQRVESMVMVSERDVFPMVGMMIHEMLRQFSPDEGFVAMLNGEPLDVGLEDIDYEADIRFVGSRQAVSRFQKVAQYREAINVMSANPDAIADFPEMYVRYLRDGMEIPDAKQIIEQAVGNVQKRLAAQQQLALAGLEAKSNKSATPSASTEGQMLTEAGGAEREGQVAA
jgi:hypothetical protein